MTDPGLTSAAPAARASMRLGNKPPRQRPGLSCLNCRSKKLKCDGEQPQCGHCTAGNVKCVTPLTSMKRGPPKGHLKTLQSRLATLEQQVLLQSSPCATMLDPALADPPPLPTPPLASAPMVVDADEHMLDDSFFNHADYSFGDAVLHMPGDAYPLPTPPDSMTSLDLRAAPSDGPFFPFDPANDAPEQPSAGQNVISDLLRTDLEQLYFERTHRFVPILHRRRFFSWAHSPHKTEAQTCLQSAMAMSAASLSSQNQSTREFLYRAATTSLAALEAKDGVRSCVEHVQARILVLIYDFMRSSHTRGWMSAGQCFRLVQLIRLFETDGPGRYPHGGGAPDDWIAIEERRRAFWMAFCLDIHISIRQEWPLMLHEHTKNVRLPMPEDRFQNGEHVEMGYLPDDLGSVDPDCRSPFNEFIICSAIYMRSTLHKQQTRFGPDMDHAAFWARHDRLDAAVRARADAHHRYGAGFPQSDPILLFTFMTLHMTVLSLYDVVECGDWEGTRYADVALEYRRRALSAAVTILEYARSLAHLSYLRAHPFTPLPLLACVQFFTKHRFLDDAHDAHIHELEDLLREMDVVNNLARRRDGHQ